MFYHSNILRISKLSNYISLYIYTLYFINYFFRTLYVMLDVSNIQSFLYVFFRLRLYECLTSGEAYTFLIRGTKLRTMFTALSEVY